MTQHIDIPAALDTPAFREAWAEWVTYRAKVKRRSVTAQAATRSFNRLAPLGPDGAIAAIQWSMDAGYIATFPDPYFRATKPATTATPVATDERWLDMLKVVLREAPEYVEAGWSEERCRATGWTTSLPYSLRQDILRAARNHGIQLRV